MRGIVAIVCVAVVVVGCTPPVRPPLPRPPDAACPPPAAYDGGPSSCAGPAYPAPDEVDDWDEFLSAASAILCTTALRRPSSRTVVLESWCHPSFGQLYVRRSRRGLPRFPRREARACLERLLTFTDPIPDALGCLELLTCAAADECCVERADDGEACGTSEDCLPWLSCADHRCTPRRACPADPCRGAEERCIDGRCVIVGFECDQSPCPLLRFGGEPCSCHADCASEFCRDGACDGLRPIGCECGDDRDCPEDVSECRGGVCRARPMLGEECASPESPRCFGSTCDGAVCGPIPVGDRGCAMDTECVAGARCVFVPCTGPLCTDSVCVAPPSEGEPCVEGRCFEDLVCRDGRCVRPAIGDACLGPAGCLEAHVCADGHCVAALDEGVSCATQACARGLLCLDGVCRPVGSTGTFCDPETRQSCARDFFCREHRCERRALLGAACETGLDSCEPGASCSGGTCVESAALGEACVEGSCVPSARCIDALCYGRSCR